MSRGWWCALLLLLWVGAAQAQDAPKAGAESESGAGSESESEAGAEVGAEAGAETEAEAEAETESEAEAGSGTEAEAETETEAGSESEAEAGSESEGESAADAAGFADFGDEAWGDGDDGADTIGFGEADAPTHATGLPPGELSASGFVRTHEALWLERLDERPLAKARQSLDLGLRYKKRLSAGADPPMLRMVGDIHFEQDLAYLIDRDDFDDATLDTYESQIIGGESFAALSVGAFELTVGRQIVAWGQGEMLSPLDVVNPRDMRELGLAELDDVRMAVLASRVGVFVEQHRFEVMLVHESFFGLTPPPFSDFSPLRALVLNDPVGGSVLAGRGARFEHVPGRFDAKAGQVFGRWSWTGPGIDLALYGASLLDRRGIPQLPDPADLLTVDPLVLRLYHPRYTMAGHAGALPAGDFVLRWELGVEIDRPLLVTDVPTSSLDLRVARHEQVNGMLGITFGGIEDGSIGFEVAQQWLPGGPSFEPGQPGLLAPVEEPAFALRWMQNLMRERMRVTMVGTAFGVTEFLGWFARAEAGYDIVDALELGLGVATYHPHGEALGPLLGLDRHDRLFTWMRWDFLLN